MTNAESRIIGALQGDLCEAWATCRILAGALERARDETEGGPTIGPKNGWGDDISASVKVCRNLEEQILSVLQNLDGQSIKVTAEKRGKARQ